MYGNEGIQVEGERKPADKHNNKTKGTTIVNAHLNNKTYGRRGAGIVYSFSFPHSRAHHGAPI